MSVAERELIDRPTAMPFKGEDAGEIFQLPKVNEDIKQDRYLFTAINMITPAIVRDRAHMKDGGLNIHNPCLRHTGDFVRRGRIVPLLTNTHTPIPVEEANAENSAYFEIPAGGDATFRGDSPLPTEGGYVGYPAYPGQQINHILEGSVIGGIQHLLGEISTLKGHKYTLKDMGGFLSDPDLWQLQLAIFPTYPEVPVTLSEFTQQVQTAFDSNTGDIRNVAQDMLPICEQCDAWAIRHIETVHQNMAQAATKGYAHPYDQVDLLILTQLGMTREDEHFKRTAQQAAATAQQPRVLSHEEYVSMKNEIIAEFRAEQAAARVQPDQNTMAAAPITNATPEGQEAMSEAIADTEKFVCDCGQEAKSLAGLKAHQRSCEQVKSE
jgi:hypothetical protein